MDKRARQITQFQIQRCRNEVGHEKTTDGARKILRPAKDDVVWCPRLTDPLQKKLVIIISVGRFLQISLRLYENNDICTQGVISDDQTTLSNTTTAQAKRL
jgi:hypothetical protein